jgi:branched-chain amino acid transport system substrate-binding protein
MMLRAVSLILSLACTVPAAAQEFRIGFINTTTGSGAIIGQQLENGFRLGLAQHGWSKDGDKLAGTPTRVFFSDDQVKPDLGLREAEKLLKQEQVHAVAGIIWGNVFTAVARPVFESRKLLVGGVSGLAQFAGESCQPLFVSASHQNDQVAEATGELVTRRGVKNIVALAPNYQAGKEFLDAFERSYKGKVIERVLFKLGEADFQAEFSKVRALKPEAAVVFAPGAMGIAFLRQWHASGLRQDIPVYSFYTIDESNLAAIGDAAIGVFDTNNWTPELPNPANQAFVKEYLARFGTVPAIYSVYGYDVVNAFAVGLKATGGRFEDPAAMARAIRQAGISSPRGELKYNVNGFLVQPYYAREVVRKDGQLAIVARETIMTRPDSLGEKCPPERRI